MKTRLPLVAVALLAFAGCASFDRRELAQMRSRGVPPSLVDKLAHDRPVTPPEVIVLTRHGMAPATLVTYIHAAGVNYVLNGDDARHLRQAHVSPYVVDALAEESALFAGEYRRPGVRVGFAYGRPYGWGGWGDPYGWGGEPYGYGPNGAYWW